MQALQRITRGAIAAVVLGAGLAALPAIAQPGGRHHGGGEFLAHLGAVKAQLNLDASQQTLWDAAVAAGKSARETAHARRANVRQVVAEEAAKARPDLARIATATDAIQASNTTARHAVRDQWLKLYSTFRDDQVAVVKHMLANRAARMDSFRDRIKQRFGHE